MILKKIIISFALIIVVVMIAAIGIVLSTDFNQYKDHFTDRVEKLSGRQFAIAGDIELELSLHPGLVVHGVTLGNASWASSWPWTERRPRPRMERGQEVHGSKTTTAGAASRLLPRRRPTP